MTLEDLQTIMLDQPAFRRALKRTDVIELLTGKFEVGRQPFVHQLTFPNGSQLRLKFYSTIKCITNTKGQDLPGKESYLSYLEVTAILMAPLKSYVYTTDVTQVVWGFSKNKALIKHTVALAELAAQGTALGIDLDLSHAWCRTYTENH